MTLAVLASSSSLTLVALPPEGLGIVVPARPATAEEVFAANPDVAAVIGGPMFGFCDGQPHDYARYDCGVVRYALADARRGVRVAGARENDARGLTFSVVGTQLAVARGNAPAPGATVAVQTYPGLVEDGAVAVGAPTGGPDAEVNGRVAMGVLRDGRAFFAYGRTSLRAFAERLRDAGATWAGYTDGGGSSSLVVRDAAGALIGVDADDPRGRRLPSWIVWAPPRGAVPWSVLLGLAGAGAVGVAALRWRRAARR